MDDVDQDDLDQALLEHEQQEYRRYKLEEFCESLIYLKSFLRQAWPYFQGAETPFIDGWHIGAICEHLEACKRREIRNLLVNVPPRTAKSSIISIALVPWWWLTEPSTEFYYASHTMALSRKHSLQAKRLIESEWYQGHYWDRYQLRGDQKTKERFENDKYGARACTSCGAGSTGFGGDVLITDDPNNAQDGESEAKRENTNDWWGSTWSTRLNNANTGVRIVIQQRLHENDLSGYIMSNDDQNVWTRLILPMEFEKGRCAKTIILSNTNNKVWQDPRTQEGELLWPNGIDEKRLKQLKKDLGSSYRIAGQLQQRPAPEEGGIFKKHWFKWWCKPNKPENVSKIIQSWDTALEDGEENAYSACTTWGVFPNEIGLFNLILLSLWRGRVSYPDLRYMAKQLYADYTNVGEIGTKSTKKNCPDVVLVEAKASGHSLLQDLRLANIPVSKFDPTKHGDKMQRVHLVTPMVEGGRVWVAAQPESYIKLRPSAALFVDLCAIFPNSDSRDVVDTMAQVILRLKSDGYLYHPTDERHTERIIKPKHGFYGPSQHEG